MPYGPHLEVHLARKVTTAYIEQAMYRHFTKGPDSEEQFQNGILHVGTLQKPRMPQMYEAQKIKHGLRWVVNG